MAEETPSIKSAPKEKKTEEKGSSGKDLEKEKARLGAQRKQEFGELRGKAIYDRTARRELEQREKEAEIAEEKTLKKSGPGWDPTFFVKEEAERKRMQAEREKGKSPKKGGWFQKIPGDVLLSPGGMVLIFFALVMELVDLIPIPVIDQIWELPFEIIFIVLLSLIAKTSLKSAIIPFIIERIPGISDILPTWVIRMLT